MSKGSNTKRMRVFGGPNGSGKSSIIKEVRKRAIDTGLYINADDIEKTVAERKFLNLADYDLESTSQEFDQYLHNSTLLQKAVTEGYKIDLQFSNNNILIGEGSNSYEAAIISEYIRRLLLAKGSTFSFETVMSHSSKLQIFKDALSAGYRTYLYFVGTVSVEININRVSERVKKGGHPVAEDKIRERYEKSMDLLYDMLPYVNRCYLIDNSLNSRYRLIGEITDGSTVDLFYGFSDLPIWIKRFLLDKLGV
ncbi:hypothetical protein [uncultured Chitinophaga sp.]|uniref:hypothetical protein n=1 Tax=uncultured Chitinophaga sp. TaxID=339340 RepID=UPI0025EC8C8B|nr:hypothetical protein [uncultured Chitinophaga sp.]